ncbi:MAG: ribonuclease P protein subunit [Candidatus Thermoplasmatota archaeon]|nr:ribonuclease P protein subunit [Candidatus Thermoplasmatota archaeon]
MNDLIHLPWISHTLTVLDSTDPTLVGVSGVVQDETRRTVKVQTQDGTITLAKDTIRFKIGDEEIDGATVKQRPEDRIAKRYGRR